MPKTVLISTVVALLCAGCFSQSPENARPAVWRRPEWDGTPQSLRNSRTRPLVGSAGMAVSDDREASEWAAEILRRGGNAVDAAVGAAYLTAVSRPHHTGIGGGGYLLYCPATATGSRCFSVDFREVSPSATDPRSYFKEGKPVPELASHGPLAVGAPGFVAGLSAALEKWGSVPLSKLLVRPIELAKRGITVTGEMELAREHQWQSLDSEARRVFSCGRPESPCPAGALLRQPELAHALERIAQNGPQSLYRGELARRIATHLRSAGGVLSAEDLARYQVRLPEPLAARLPGFEIVTVPPSSSGGIGVVETLSLIQLGREHGLLGQRPDSQRTIAFVGGSMAQTFADRAAFLGDPEFVKISVPAILSEERLAGLLRPMRRSPPESDSREAGNPGDTTHISVVDRHGRAVSVTTSVNGWFGSGVMPKGTGILLNNAIERFTLEPGKPGAMSIVDGPGNLIAPLKRPLSSLAPTIVRFPSGGAVVLGGIGGPRIVTSTAWTLLQRIHFGLSISDSVASPRIHHQWQPNRLELESLAFAPEPEGVLRKTGFQIRVVPKIGIVHALERFPNGRVWGAPDPRGEGAAAIE